MFNTLQILKRIKAKRDFLAETIIDFHRLGDFRPEWKRTVSDRIKKIDALDKAFNKVMMKFKGNE